MAKLKYPKTVAAWRTAENWQWKVGDALLEECGPSSDQGVRDGSYERLVEAYGEIQEHCDGEDCSTMHLADLRRVAEIYPETRRRLVSWSVHEEAGDPKILDEIIKSAKDTKVTRDLVRAYMDKRSGKSKGSPPPNRKGGSPPPAPKNKGGGRPPKGGLDRIARIAGFSAKASSSDINAEDAMEEIEPILDKLDEDDIAALVELSLNAMNAWKKAADFVRSKQTNKRAHLKVVS